DVLVYAARPGHRYGHAVLVADVARNRRGGVMVMVVEGNTPAREIHVVRNPLHPIRSPWFSLSSDDDVFVIAPFVFCPDELKTWKSLK
ncbi:MAG: hypothetical protein J6Y77_02460, partial [Paludibacteraceae bacterium]|nr:hypothetical protein [Paludibacteraceae bacterium]